MIRSLWIAKTGMEAQQTQMDTVSNNLANVSTNGFKKSRAVFEDLLYQNVRQPGANSSQQTQLPSGMQIGTGVRPVTIERIHTQGNPQASGNDKDLMVNGNGFFSVLMPDGTTGYTRDGSFQRDNNGQMVTSSGYVLQPPITIPINADNITVGKDGTVSVRCPARPPRNRSARCNWQRSSTRPACSRWARTCTSRRALPAPPSRTSRASNGMGVILQGYVETSNVNVVEEMVNMIQTQRAYEINSKAITTSDQMLQKLSQM
jgi:flagellar basal-body rod protein FlgG